jgi:predicted N-acyltransferase
LAKALIQWCEAEKLSSLHLLFTSKEDGLACADAGMMLRHTVQFHWRNSEPVYADFEGFLASLSQEKRKKIRQERRKVADAGVTFRWAQGAAITSQDWDFFYRCYERTYLEHGNAPYLNRDFFQRMASTMPENWLLFVAEREGQPIATSLIAIHAGSTGASDQNDLNNKESVAYGRYWGALERVDCLHFEACYYQPLAWCIAHGYQRFEGGAQGEHKMARALLPVKTSSAHWLAHPAFADAVERFLEREGQGIGEYLDDLAQRSPFKQPTGA